VVDVLEMERAENHPDPLLKGELTPFDGVYEFEDE
jgi:hypothetical protein